MHNLPCKHLKWPLYLFNSNVFGVCVLLLHYLVDGCSLVGLLLLFIFNGLLKGDRRKLGYRVLGLDSLPTFITIVLSSVLVRLLVVLVSLYFIVTFRVLFIVIFYHHRLYLILLLWIIILFTIV